MDESLLKYYGENLSESEREEVSRIQLRSVLALKGQDSHDSGKSLRKFIFRRRLSRIVRTTLRVAPLLLVIALFLIGNRRHPESVQVSYMTTFAPSGHMAKCVLPDGTQVTLNANSKLTYPSFFDDQRRVSLEGEAFFEVSADRNHPFIVSTYKLEVKALGTKFNISDYSNDNFVVSLLEGSVFIYQDDFEESGLYLKPNEQLVESDGGYVKKLFIQNPVMWVNGFYAFNNNSMEYILSKLELYYDVRIIVLNEQLLKKTYTGKFRQTDGVREILRVMSRIYPFTIKEDETTNTIYVQ
ncbi:MAG: FecR domain-containing protein [Bacteroidales bacterium]|nr:FecR domain-containing protein [Bacteroidales bacterium]